MIADLFFELPGRRLLLLRRPLQLDLAVDPPAGLEVNPEVVERLVLLVDEVGEADGAVGDEGVGRDGGVVPHRQPQHLRLPQQVRRERLVPCRILHNARKKMMASPNWAY